MDQLVSMIISGKYLAAVGISLVAFVGVARALLTRLSPWFSTKLGGYVIAYVSAFGLYLGSALQSGTSVDAHLLMTALASALASSGILDHWRDLFSVVKKSVVSGAIVSSAVLLTMVISCQSCAGTTPTGGSIVNSIVDCANQGQDALTKIETLIAQMSVIAFGNAPDKWSQVETLAANNGLTVGGCAIAQVVNSWITKKSLKEVDAQSQIVDAKTMFESFRTNYAGGASFRTKTGTI